MGKRYIRAKSGEMVEHQNGGWIQYHHVETLLKSVKRLQLAAEGIGGEHVTGLMDLDNALVSLDIALRNFYD